MSCLDNQSNINETFIIKAFKKSDIHFYLSNEKGKIFSSLNQIIREKYSDLKKVSLSYLLRKNIDINQIEELIEKSEINFKTFPYPGTIRP